MKNLALMSLSRKRGTSMDEITESILSEMESGPLNWRTPEEIPIVTRANEEFLKYAKRLRVSIADYGMTPVGIGGDVDEQVSKLVDAMNLVDEAYKWFLETSWHRDATEDCMAIQRHIGQLITDIHDIRKFKEDK